MSCGFPIILAAVSILLAVEVLGMIFLCLCLYAIAIESDVA